MGPPGPQGPQGEQGLPGNDGTQGVSGTAGCLECHSSDVKYDVTMEYESSVHAQGVAAAYAGGRGSCAACHSNEGFQESQYTGLMVTQDFPFPTRISCTTCHSWHNESLDEAEAPDYALRTVAPVDLLMFSGGDDPVTVDFQDPSNLCANCHQPRTAAPADDGSSG